jgi:hypothetical protein
LYGKKGDLPPNNFIASVRGLKSPIDDYYLANVNDTHFGFLELDFNNTSLLGTFYANNLPNSAVAIDNFTVSKN